MMLSLLLATALAVQQPAWHVQTFFHKDGKNYVGWALNCAATKDDSLLASRILIPKGAVVDHTVVEPAGEGWRAPNCHTTIRDHRDPFGEQK